MSRKIKINTLGEPVVCAFLADNLSRSLRDAVYKAVAGDDTTHSVFIFRDALYERSNIVLSMVKNPLDYSIANAYSPGQTTVKLFRKPTLCP